MPDVSPPTCDTACERLDAAERRDHVATQHWARYEWACAFLPRRRVLDCACGLGYGAALLRVRGAARVVGVDVSAEAVAEARRRYADPTIEYVEADGRELTLEQVGRFDLIVSLETIEHMTEPQRLLDAFLSLLEPDGLLLLSMPNDRHLGARSPYHAWTADLEEVRAWLHARFAQVLEFGEAHVVGTCIEPRERMESPPAAHELRTCRWRPIDVLPLPRAPGFLFACSPRPIHVPPASHGALLRNGFEYQRELQEACRRLWEQCGQLSTEIERGGNRIRELEAIIARLWDQARKLGADVETLKVGFEERGRRVAELEAIVGAARGES
jgi:2-polyprenyl-3-methyl-5-hydroxy-6-metoxy-1,4-benzoquinol methylase